MKELSKEELLEKLKWFYTRWDLSAASYMSERAEQAYKQIRKKIQEKSKVTRKNIFDFHNALTTIVEDSENPQECYDREIDYIYHWLKSKGVQVED